MKKQFLFFNLFVAWTIFSYGQEKSWKLSNEALKFPSTYYGAESTVGFVNKYDTVACQYKLSTDEKTYTGYKLVFVKNGYYIDDNTTMNVFFDERKKRVDNVFVYLL